MSETELQAFLDKMNSRLDLIENNRNSILSVETAQIATIIECLEALEKHMNNIQKFIDVHTGKILRLEKSEIINGEARVAGLESMAIDAIGTARKCITDALQRHDDRLTAIENGHKKL